jgi:putative heme-binding domain-containing protein
VPSSPSRFANSMSCTVLSYAIVLCLQAVAPPSLQAAEPDYQTTDPELKVVTLDSAPTESFLAVKLDSEGRIFVGGREQLFVYEPLSNGKYGPRTSLLKLPDHSWIYDIEIRGNDVYILTVSALYVLPDARIRRDGLTIKRLVWGVPLGHVHQCFHGMTWGPDGDLYIASGDPLWYYGDFNRADHWGHWNMFSQPEDSQVHLQSSSIVKTPYNGVGAVFRCRPNGSHLQVVARGLRNGCGLTFDKNWNLFTNDNDHESMPAEYVPGRLNHVTPHSYFSWPRGWMLSKTPDRKDLLDTMITTLGRAVPVGQWYYSDTFLPEKYRDALLVARWCTRKVTYYPLKPHGSTFKCEEHELLVGRDQARPVGVTVGRGGRIFATICYMAQNEGSPIYKSDLVMITKKDDPESLPFDGYDVTTAPMDRLLKEISNPNWSRRYMAHVELQRRTPVLPASIIGLAEKATAEDPAARHLPWLVASGPGGPGTRVLETLASQHQDPTVRLQALRAYGEVAPQFTTDKETWAAKWMKDENPQVQQAAVTLCFNGSNKPITPAALEALVAGPAVSDDTYQRQAATFLIAERGGFDTIGNLCQNGNPKVRLAGVLAAGAKLTLPATHAVPSPELPLSPWRGDEAYLIQFADTSARTDLRTVNPRIGLYTVADHWKAAKRTTEQEQLFDLLEVRLGDESEEVRSQAAYFLSLLNDSRTEPLISRIRSDITQRKLSLAPLNAVTKAWVAGPFNDFDKGFKTIHEPEKSIPDPAAVFRSGKLQLAWNPVTITRQINFLETYGPCDDQSFYVILRLESATKQSAILGVGSDDGVKVWHNGKVVWVNDIQRGALPVQDSVPLELQPGGNDILLRVHNIAGESGLYLHYRSLQPVVAVLPEKIAANTFAARLKDAAAAGNSTPVDPKFFDIDWIQAAKTGNVENGKKLFSVNGLGCAKCHAVSADAAINAGPSLADAAKRFTVPHIVESVLLPGKQISPVFKATLVVTKDGRQHLGLVTGETAEKLELILNDATKLSIPIKDIEERKLQEASPMPQGLVKTPEELKDLLAYLLGG